MPETHETDASGVSASPSPRAEGPWFTRPVEEVVDGLGTDRANGLSSAEAEERLERHGPNELLREEAPGPWSILAGQLGEPLVVVLVLAAAVSALAWLVGGEGSETLPWDALVILAIVVLNALLGFVQEYRAERAVESLRAMTAPTARVRRDGTEVEVEATRVVPGDLLLLETGDRIAADARVVEAVSLRTEEAVLTGESVGVGKGPAPLDDPDTPVGDRSNMVFMGTSVNHGHGSAVVVATGMATAMGDIAGLLRATPDEATPLEDQLARVGKHLGMLVIGLSLVVAVGGLARAGTLSWDVALQVFVFAVALAVAAVPEGLPAVVTGSLALGVRRLADRNAIVRHLPAVEALGSADVIGSDKTGTLTRNEMTVRRILLGDGREIAVGGEGFEPEGDFRRVDEGDDPSGPGSGDRIDPGDHDPLVRLLRLGALNNDARLLREEEGRWSVRGDPTEGALLVVAEKADLDVETLRRDHPREGEIPFTGERKRMTTIHVVGGVRTAVVKGGPEVVLERCDRVRAAGDPEALDEAGRRDLLEASERFARNALRTLALASRALPGGVDEDDPEGVEAELVFEGVFAMLDPPREGTRASVEEAAAAGVRTVMLTGDHVLTARAIAEQVGIAERGADVLSGRDVAAMDDAGLDDRVETVDVYGRIGPGEKLRVLQALKRRGHTVAMTGDGVNDAPAVKEADIGVAMGRSGTDVTRDASDVVLTDDDYSTLVAAISEGRRIFDNIRSFIRYLLSANAGEVLTIFAAVMFGGALGFGLEGGELFLPLLPTQILWINLVTDGAPALALGMSPAVPGHMRRPPRDPGEPVIDRPMWIRVGVVGVVIMLGTLVVLDAYLPGGATSFMADAGRGDPHAYARTAAFTTLLVFEMFDVFNCLSPTRSVLRSGAHRNPWLLGAVAFSVVLHAGVLYLPPLQTAFSTVPLGLSDWLVAIAVAASVVVASEVLKRTPLVR